MLTECLQLFNFDLYKWFEGYRITLWVTFWWNIEYFFFFSTHVGWVGCWFPPLLLTWSFFSGYSSFPPSSKTKIFKSNLTRNQVDEEPLSGCVTSKSSFIYLFYLTKKTFCGKKAQLAVYQWSSLACLLASSLTSRSSPKWRACVHRLGYHW